MSNEIPKLIHPEVTEIVLTMIKNERVEQDMKHGIVSRTEDEWIAITSDAIIAIQDRLLHPDNSSSIKELIHAAATLTAWIESEYMAANQKSKKKE